jgi:hypothetical protein
VVVAEYLLDGRRPDPQGYRIAREALQLIADPIGRAGGRGRPIIWRLKDKVLDKSKA